jgi:hypothetical protein
MDDKLSPTDVDVHHPPFKWAQGNLFSSLLLRCQRGMVAAIGMGWCFYLIIMPMPCIGITRFCVGVPLGRGQFIACTTIACTPSVSK